MDGAFAEELNSRHLAWRRVVTLGVACGIPVRQKNADPPHAADALSYSASQLVSHAAK